MTPEEIRAFLLEGTRTAKLATTMRDGSPHVMPVWFTLDGDEIVFNTAENTAKGRNIRRDPRVAILVDDDAPPFSFVHIRGPASISEDADELLHWATVIAGRYMGADRAEEFGRRNGVPGELVVRVKPERVIALGGIAD
jgi:PPOX class probable F420-dependent enzyme